MMRAYFSLAFLIVASTGCTIVTRTGGAQSPEPERVAAAPHEERPERRPARPRPRPKAEQTTPAATQPPEKVPLAKPEPRSDTRPSTKPEPRPDTKPSTKPEPRPETKPEPQPEPKPQTKPEPKPQPRPSKLEPKAKQPVEEKGFVFGVPKDMKPGFPDALWLYQDADGWHLRTTTTDEVTRKFKGRVWLSEGKLSSATAPTGDGKNEGNDTFKIVNQSIEFYFETSGMMDGIDFAFTGTKCLHVEVTMNGVTNLTVIRLGARMVNPSRNPFMVCGN